VDLRRSSPTFGRWFGTTLVAGDGRQLWIPEGCAHGFLVLSESADVSYKCTAFRSHNDERSVRWNDDSIGIHWPLPAGGVPILSEKDKSAPTFANAELFA
jgi:dTDP-4-dehydrorhamnose 3,5-epimerase